MAPPKTRPGRSNQPLKPRTSRLAIGYAVYGGLVLATYVAAGLFGWTGSGSPEPNTVPASVRASPGGYRSYHFWHSGYQGGK